MPTLEETSAAFKAAMNEMHLHYHEDLYNAIVKYLGPTINHADATLVACSDPKELETVKKNFLIGKLGLEDNEELDHLIQQVCHGLGESNNKKYRTTFYYLLVALTKKESVFLSE